MPMVTAPTAFHMVATNTMVCKMALLRLSPNTPTKVKVAKRPAPDDREPENKPMSIMQTAPKSVRESGRCSKVFDPNPFFSNE